MKNTKTIGILMVLLAGTGLVGNVEGAAPAFSSNTFPDIAGVEVNRTVDYLERERVARQIAEDQAKRQEKIKDTVTQQEETADKVLDRNRTGLPSHPTDTRPTPVQASGRSTSR